MAMQENKNKELNSSSFSYACFSKFHCFPTKFLSSKSPPPPPPSSVPPLSPPENGSKVASLQRRKPGGWKAMPFVLGNESFERLASLGLIANFMVFLLTEYHMEQVLASNVLNIWSGITNFAPLVGAFISDAYTDRFTTIAYASFASLTGLLTLTIIAWLPQLRPPTCNTLQSCQGPTKFQFGILAVALGFLTIGSGGIRPCSIPFGVDQFDSNTQEGRKGINSFFNWYYTTFTIVMIIALTVVVYIQDSVSWVLGFGILTVLMICSILLFFVGTRFYVYVKPEGSVFSGIAYAAVAAYKKRDLNISEGGGPYYDPPARKGSVVEKLPLTNKYRFLNKAAMITEGDIQPNGSISNPWRLCTIQQIEEIKCILKVIPVWASGIICFTAIVQQATFTISQASKMDRRLTSNFKIPPGTLGVISMMTIGIWVPIYDRFVVTSIRKVTKLEGGITLIQRMGIGLVFAIMSMVVSGLVERMRRGSALRDRSADGVAPMTVFWLAPQLVLMGFAEAFNIIGQIEFYNKEFPDSMSSLANALLSCTMAGASYLSALVVNIVHDTTGSKGRPDWLTKDINDGKVENLYFLIAGLGGLNLVYFVWVSRGYQYKSRIRIGGVVEDDDDVEKSIFEVEKQRFDVENNVVKLV